jgi:hypothetical protein
MKKCFHWLTTIAILISANSALADDPELFTLAVNPSVAKCMGSDPCVSQYYASQNISIALDNCVDVDGAYSNCSGQWQGTVSQDGYAFNSTVVVVKTAEAPVRTTAKPKVNAYVQYQITATTAPAWSTGSPTSVNMMLGQVGTVTDAITFSGESFAIVNTSPQVYYKPFLSIGSAQTGPVPGSSRHAPQP